MGLISASHLKKRMLYIKFNSDFRGFKNVFYTPSFVSRIKDELSKSKLNALKYYADK